MSKTIFILLVNIALMFKGYEQAAQCENQKLCPPSNGTTKNIRDIIRGRCNDYLYVKQPGFCSIRASNYNCDSILTSFTSAIIGQRPCWISMSSFNKYFRLTNQNIPANKSVLWYGTDVATHDFTHLGNYISLEDTLSGYLINRLTFCSKKKSNNFDYESCPYNCVACNSSFWNAAARNFAEKASGTVSIILNGTNPEGAYSNSSTLAKYQIPYLNSRRVDSARIILLNSPGQGKNETCSNPESLTDLFNALTAENISYTCIDGAKEILAIFCDANPFSATCLAVTSLLDSETRK